MQASNSDADFPLVNILELPGKHMNYGLHGPNQPATTQLSAADKVVVNSVFKDDIEAGRLLTSHPVRSKMWHDLHIRPIT